MLQQRIQNLTLLSVFTIAWMVSAGGCLCVRLLRTNASAVSVYLWHTYIKMQMKIWSSFVTIESDQNRWIDGWWTRDDDNDMPAPETYKKETKKKASLYSFFFFSKSSAFSPSLIWYTRFAHCSHAFHFVIVVLRRKRNPISSNRIQILNFSWDWRTQRRQQKNHGHIERKIFIL